MNNIRKRLINFRVTDQEYERIKASSDREGARCVSEFARTVMMGTPKPDTSSDGANASNGADATNVNEKLLAFERRLAMLELCVLRLGDGLSGAKTGRFHSES